MPLLQRSCGVTRRRLARFLGIALSILLLIASVAIWNFAFRTPSIDLLPLPTGLIALESSAGQQLLAEGRFIADYDGLTKAFESQSRPAFCGVASSVVVLNALRGSGPRLTQSTFFNDLASEVRVTLAGMSLAQLADLLHAHGLKATLFYASATDVEAFRALAQTNLESSGDFLLVNYQRAELGQDEIGHISPLAGYNAETDRLLILDVAAYKYPSVWVSVEALWNAMNTVDSASGRTRGFIAVRQGASNT